MILITILRIQDQALTEPLVDVVDPDQICTNTCVIKKIDIRTMKKEDATFTAPFKLTASRNDYIHAVVASFDIFFDCGVHKTISFSTGPRARTTHWKQTVFYLSDHITAHQNEQLTGEISVKPNEKNNRDLDIDITYEFDGKLSQMKLNQSYKMR
jgi:protein arginine N-methyltransferase 1